MKRVQKDKRNELVRFTTALYRKLLPHALARAREQAGLSIEEAASQSGMNELTIRNHEFGTHLPAMDYFLVELQIYGLDFGRFHELLVEAYNDLVDEEMSQRVDHLEARLKVLEEASTPTTKAG